MAGPFPGASGLGQNDQWRYWFLLVPLGLEWTVVAGVERPSAWQPARRAARTDPLGVLRGRAHRRARSCVKCVTHTWVAIEDLLSARGLDLAVKEFPDCS